MYQRKGRLGISSHIVRHPSFYFTMRLFTYYQLIPLSIILSFLEKSIVEPNFLKYLSDTLTDHYFSEPQKKHSLLASHPAEPHPTDQRSLLSLEK